MPDWSKTLAKPIGYLKPTRGRIATLSDARAYSLQLGGREKMASWQSAAESTIAAAAGGDVEAVTRQIEIALMYDAALDVRA